jgi:hypothetical protein
VPSRSILTVRSSLFLSMLIKLSMAALRLKPSLSGFPSSLEGAHPMLDFCRTVNGGSEGRDYVMG